MHKILIYWAIKYQGNWDLIYQALEKREKVSLQELIKVEKAISKNNWNIITLLDYDYPKQLKTSYKPPFILWYQGDKKILEKNHFITLTGEKETIESCKEVKTFVPETTWKYCLVTNELQNLDKAIMKEFDKEQKPIVLVQPQGFRELDQTNPNWKNYLILSEFPPQTSFSNEKERASNRLVAALSEQLVLVNSKKESQMQNLVTNFLNLGKDVNCLLGEKTKNEGNVDLIKQGATLITEPKDLWTEEEKVLFEKEIEDKLFEQEKMAKQKKYKTQDKEIEEERELEP